MKARLSSTSAGPIRNQSHVHSGTSDVFVMSTPPSQIHQMCVFGPEDVGGRCSNSDRLCIAKPSILLMWRDSGHILYLTSQSH